MLFNNVTSSTVMIQNTSIVVNQTFTNNGSSVVGNQITSSTFNSLNLTIISNTSNINPGTANYSYGTNTTNSILNWQNFSSTVVLNHTGNATYSGLFSLLVDCTVTLNFSRFVTNYLQIPTRIFQ